MTGPVSDDMGGVGLGGIQTHECGGGGLAAGRRSTFLFLRIFTYDNGTCGFLFSSLLTSSKTLLGSYSLVTACGSGSSRSFSDSDSFKRLAGESLSRSDASRPKSIIYWFAVQSLTISDSNRGRLTSLKKSHESYTWSLIALSDWLARNEFPISRHS